MLLLIHCLFLLPLFVGVLCWSWFCYVVLSVLSSFAIILMGKMSSLLYLYCLPDVLWLWVFGGFSSWCLGLVCSVRLRHFLVILTFSKGNKATKAIFLSWPFKAELAINDIGAGTAESSENKYLSWLMIFRYLYCIGERSSQNLLC